MASYRRPGASAKKSARVYIGVAIAAVIIVAVVIIIAVSSKSAGDPVAKATISPTVIISVEPSVAPSIEPTSAPTSAPTSTPVPVSKYNVVMPTPIHDGFLPIFAKGETTDKIIAITVDDFYQFKNARTIIDAALSANSKLTIFPIGKNALRDELQDTIRYAHDNGIEIENHTYEHKPLYDKSDSLMAKQIYLQSLAIDHVLGVEYQEHFFRPMGGDGRDDQRTHLYVKQLGMYGIAHWSVSGSGTSLENLKSSIKPGNIYLFHTTDSDTEKLKKFIPWCVSEGYTLVTLNEMFGFPENEVSELKTPIKERTIEEIEPYTLVPRTLKVGDYLWQVYLVQARLKELGYTSSEPDGIFGNSTANDIKEFQTKAGLKANGKANAATQEALFKDDAPRK